jgi:hypothetical protein
LLVLPEWSSIPPSWRFPLESYWEQTPFLFFSLGVKFGQICVEKTERARPFAATSFPKFVLGSALYNCRYTDVFHSSMEHARSVSPLDLGESVLKDLDNQQLSAHASVLDHLQVRSGLVVDAQPFLDSLRREYHEQLARSVSDPSRFITASFIVLKQLGSRGCHTRWQ